MSPESDEVESKEHPVREGGSGECGLVCAGAATRSGKRGDSCLILWRLVISTPCCLAGSSLHCLKPSVKSTSTQSSGTNVFGRTSQEGAVWQALGRSCWGHKESCARGQRETAWKCGARSASGTCWNLPENLPGPRPSHSILEAMNPILFLSQNIQWLQSTPGLHWSL